MSGYLFSEGNSIALVTLNNIPNQIGGIATLFQKVAQAGIIVDMISQTAPTKDTIDVSFTIPEESMPTLFALLKELKEMAPSLSMDLSGGNAKIVIRNEQMKYQAGVAARVFQLIAEENIPLTLVTTGEEEISILLHEADFKQAVKKLKTALN